MAPTTSTTAATVAATDATAGYDEIFANARKKTVRMVDINGHFICHICKGYLRDAQTIKECLHTFCNGCIRNYFWQNENNNSCPICNVDLGVKPWTQLMPDPTIQALAIKLLPDYTDQEKREERAFYAKLGVKRKRSEPAVASIAPPTELIVKNKYTLGPSPGRNIRFELHPHKCSETPLFLFLRPLKTPYMRTQVLLKIFYLRKYIAQELELPKPEDVEILCKGVSVGPEQSLEFIYRTRWLDETSKMVLEYRRQVT